MYKVMYVCDHCGKDMGNSPKFTVTFKSNTLAIQEPKEWHYCSNCWTQVKRFLSEGGIVYKDSPSPSLYRCGFVTTTTTSDEGKITQGKPIIGDEFTHSSPYTSYTINTSGEKTIQAEPMGDGPFTAGCCCENTNKDSLNYKQTTGI